MNPFRPLPVALRQGSGSRETPVARAPCERVPGRRWLDPRGDADGGEVARDTARRIGPADRAGGDEERYGHALAATLEDPEVPANKTRGRKQRPCRVTIGSRRWRVLRRGPERRDEVRGRDAGASREHVVDDPLSIDGELDRAARARVGEARAAETEHVERPPRRVVRLQTGPLAPV